MISDLERVMRSMVAIEGITSAAGTINTFVDTARIEGVDYWNGRVIVALSGSARGQSAVIIDDDGAGTLTVRPALSAAPGATQPYIILNQISDMVTGGLGVPVSKALVFANQTGQVPLFTVTGDVIVRIVAVVKTNCGSAGGCNVSVGIAADVDAIIPVTDITLLTAQEIWFDATPDSEIEALGTMREHIISDGNDITLNSSAADNSGAITFYCFWTALSAGATVVAA